VALVESGVPLFQAGVNAGAAESVSLHDFEPAARAQFRGGIDEVVAQGAGGVSSECGCVLLVFFNSGGVEHIIDNDPRLVG